MTGLESCADFATACQRTVKLAETVRCDQERVEYYRRAFEHYRALYPALQDWYGDRLASEKS